MIELLIKFSYKMCKNLDEFHIKEKENRYKLLIR